jgi:hypothetical protein
MLKKNIKFGKNIIQKSDIGMENWKKKKKKKMKKKINGKY